MRKFSPYGKIALEIMPIEDLLDIFLNNTMNDELLCTAWYHFPLLELPICSDKHTSQERCVENFVNKEYTKSDARLSLLKSSINVRTRPSVESAISSNSSSSITLL